MCKKLCKCLKKGPRVQIKIWGYFSWTKSARLDAKITHREHEKIRVWKMNGEQAVQSVPDRTLWVLLGLMVLTGIYKLESKQIEKMKKMTIGLRGGIFINNLLCKNLQKE